jgi:peptidyl-tRNA hydrolase, PTH1 family
VKVSVAGSAGGHNGVASLLEKLGDGFVRYRLGIGPKDPPQMDIKDFVLGKFTSDEQTIVAQHLPQYLSGLDLLLSRGPEAAMNQLNRRETK